MSTGKSQELVVPFVVKEKCDNFMLWRNCYSELQLVKNMRRSRRIVMKKRRSILPRNALVNKVRTLKKLVPNCDDQSMGVEGLFRETADYIVALQTRVKLMQDMLNLLSGSSGDDDN